MRGTEVIMLMIKLLINLKNEFTLSFTSSVLDHIPDEKIIKKF